MKMMELLSFKTLHKLLHACEVECPKGISLENIARLNREFFKAKILS